MPVSRWPEDRAGGPVRRFVRTARRHRTIEIQAGPHTITTADPLPSDLRDILDRIDGRSGAHERVTSQVLRAGDLVACHRVLAPVIRAGSAAGS